MPSLYADAAIAVRPEIANTHAAALQQIAGAGTWLDGPTRVAVAREALTAHECKRCGEARQSLSPTAVSGPHDDLGLLSANVVDVVHRVTTDPGRLSRAWLKGILSGGMSDTEYVETVGVVARILSISAFARAVGLAGLAVPEPRDGEPTRRRPQAAVLEDSWVARIPESGATGELADLYAGEPNFPGVGRSLSLVPDEVYAVRDLMRVQYYDFHRVPNPRNHRKLLRVQEQLIAARVSALLECFY